MEDVACAGLLACPATYSPAGTSRCARASGTPANREIVRGSKARVPPGGARDFSFWGQDLAGAVHANRGSEWSEWLKNGPVSLIGPDNRATIACPPPCTFIHLTESGPWSRLGWPGWPHAVSHAQPHGLNLAKVPVWSCLRVARLVAPPPQLPPGLYGPRPIRRDGAQAHVPRPIGCGCGR